MDSRDQEGKHCQKEMHRPSLVVVEEQPERHEPNENRSGPSLSKNMDQSSRRVWFQRGREEKRCYSDEDGHASVEAVNKKAYLFHLKLPQTVAAFTRLAPEGRLGQPFYGWLTSGIGLLRPFQRPCYERDKGR